EVNAGVAKDDQDDVTLLLLEVRAGDSAFDNGALGSAQVRAAGSPTGPPVALYGETEDASYLAIQGRGTWVQCAAFHETADAILAAGRSLVVDLSACDYLDSTCLG